jgi:RNA polymerase sigma-70 factor (ECF subfamily)
LKLLSASCGVKVVPLTSSSHEKQPSGSNRSNPAMSSDPCTTPGLAGEQRAEPRPVFVTTHWSVVLSAQQHNSPQSAEALESLCRTYWYPLYAFVRRQGYSSHDAQDLTQGFFARLLEKDYLKSVNQEKGRFRTYLIVALKRFLANESDRERALKRGGGQNVLSLDTETAENRYRVEPAQGETADRIYERRWALTLLDRTLTRLQEEFAASGKADEFNHLKSCLTSERGSVPYSELAQALGQAEGTVRVAAHRLRKRYREVFREEIAHTVADPKEVEDEIRYLMSVLSG